MIFLVLTAVCASSSDTSYLIINRPKALANLFPNGLEERPALFGTPADDHGVMLTGSLVYAVPDDLDACNPIDTTKSTKPWPSTGTVILLVDRGSCTFVTKVRHAMEVGATACIVVDNSDEEALPQMRDDGTGDSIRIPSMLIRKRDGATLKQFLSPTSEGVSVTIGWNLPFPEKHVVVWEYFTSVADRFSVAFKRQWAAVEELLEATGKVDFVPRFFLEDGTEHGCTVAGLPCTNQCTNSGRYCAADPDQNLALGASGASVVEENLRQACLWQVLKNGSRSKWWAYTALFETACTGTEVEGGTASTPGVGNFSVKCSYDTMAGLGVDTTLVQQCVRETGGSEAEGDVNLVLENELRNRQSLGVNYMPTLLVDGVRYRGTLQCTEPISVSTCDFLNEICEAFAEGNAPEIACSPCGLGKLLDACGDCRAAGAGDFNSSCRGCDGVVHSGKQLDMCGVCGGDGKQPCVAKVVVTENDKQVDEATIPVGGVVGIVLAVAAVLGVALFCYMRRQRQRMRAEVNALMQQYLPMAERSVSSNPAPAHTSPAEGAGAGGVHFSSRIVDDPEDAEDPNSISGPHHTNRVQPL